jgi:hypothetical protein
VTLDPNGSLTPPGWTTEPGMTFSPKSSIKDYMEAAVAGRGAAGKLHLDTAFLGTVPDDLLMSLGTTGHLFACNYAFQMQICKKIRLPSIAGGSCWQHVRILI